jgi:hypothetical protein
MKFRLFPDRVGLIRYAKERNIPVGPGRGQPQERWWLILWA